MFASATLAAGALTIPSQIAPLEILPQAVAAPCPDGSNTCAPQPTQGGGPTQGNQPGTTAPQAAQTTIPGQAPDTGLQAPTQGANTPTAQGNVTPMPTVEPTQSGCIYNCTTQAPTQTPARTGEQAPTQTARPDTTEPNRPGDRQDASSLSHDEKCKLALEQLRVVRSSARGWLSPQPRDPAPALVLCSDCDVQIKTPEYGKKDKESLRCPYGAHSIDDDNPYNWMDEDSCVANYRMTIQRVEQFNCRVTPNTPAIDMSSGPSKLVYTKTNSSNFEVTDGTEISKTIGGEVGATGGVKGVELAGSIAGEVQKTASRSVSVGQGVEVAKGRELEVPAGERYGVFPVTCDYRVSVEFRANQDYTGGPNYYVGDVLVSGQPGYVDVGKATTSGGWGGAIPKTS